MGLGLRLLGRSLCCLVKTSLVFSGKCTSLAISRVVVYAGGRWGLGFGLWAVVPGSTAGSKPGMGLSLFSYSIYS